MPEEGRRFKVITAKKCRKPGRSLQVIFPQGDFERMAADFAAQEQSGCEGYAVALCGIKPGADKRSAAYMVRSLHIPGKGDLIDHSSVSVTPSADFMEAVLARAMERQSSVLEIHTHPGSPAPSFSSVDLDHGEDNGRFLKSCRTGFVMLVIGSEGFTIMEYDGESDCLLTPEAATITLLTRAGATDLFPQLKKPETEELPPTVDRQLHIWGDACQRKIQTITAGIAGLGGTGSVLLQMLVRVGVKKFVLCDPDDLELSNLSRLPYAFKDDAGRKKVRVAAGYVKRVTGDAVVKMITRPVQDARESFQGCDVLFGCTDNDGARLALNEISLKYFVPYIDTGTEIFVDDGRVRDMGGQVRVIVPGVTGCLECAEAIDHDRAAAALLSPDEASLRNAAGYVNGTGLSPAPAVITLNTIIASMASQEFVDMIARRDRHSAGNYYLYDATVPRIERFSIERKLDCPMCGREGICGMGDLPKAARSRVKTIAAPDGKSL
ncbi:MAG TPA: ThiF family adenylyltransferase [Methanocella sp.]|jgi:molybdopterin/thiamine biosynthesis adenylyltransferase